MNDIFISFKDGIKLPGFIMVDTDFLSTLYSEKELVRKVLEKFTNKTFLIDDLNRFEFLRDNFLEAVIKPKEEFLKGLGFGTENHPEVGKKVAEYAINLSKIYAHKNMAGAGSYVDLHIGGRCMMYSVPIALITGNSQHFPRFLFDRIGVINFQAEKARDQKMKTFSILIPNIENYKDLLKKLPKS